MTREAIISEYRKSGDFIRLKITLTKFRCNMTLINENKPCLNNTLMPIL